MNRCVDCKKLICNCSTRCKSCSNKFRSGKYKHSKKSKTRIGGKNHPNWKGGGVNYFGLHKWIRTYKPKPKFCEECKKGKKLTISNLSGKYNRNFKNYKWLCYKCHNGFDAERRRLKLKL